MDSYSHNSEYLTKNGRPWFPVMGEFHYSRFKNALWRRSLSRMKSCGIDIVSTYIIWIHHEETEGNICFDGDLDIRRFVCEAVECGLKVFLRIGPWVHAEVRNGGLPDFMLDKDFVPRTNDERYFEYVKEFYSGIYSQVKGLLHKDGGPIIGVQIENEYGHCGGLEGEEGEKHMRRLTQLAKSVGFDVPYFTATGWGGAATGGLLPVMGAYSDAPWDTRTVKLEPNPNYLISYERNDKNIGSDRRLGFGLTFDTGKFPYLMAELGSALNSTAHRRIATSPEDIGAMALCKLAGGCNLLGFYMYHGGTNPTGKLSTFEENRASGSLNDMPVYNYDGYAPIDQWGAYSETSRELRPLLSFIHEFGEKLCKMPAVIPEDNPKKASDLTNLRYGFRTDGERGYMFINNYQRGYKESGHKNLTIRTPDGRAVFKRTDISDGDFMIYPYNMKIGRATLKTAKATPLCRINGDYVFFTDKNPEYEIVGNTSFKLVTITRNEAKHSLKVYGEREYLIISDGDAAASDGRVTLTCNGEFGFLSYPKLKKVPVGFEYKGKRGELFEYVYVRRIPNEKPEVLVCRDSETEYSSKIKYTAKTFEDVILNIDFYADSYEIEADGKTVNDGFYTGDPAKLGLAYHGYPENLRIKLKPLYENAGIYIEKPPVFRDGVACCVNGISARELRSVSFEI